MNNAALDHDTYLLQGSEPPEWLPGIEETKPADICGFAVIVKYCSSNEPGEHIINEVYFKNIPHDLLVQLMAHEESFCDLFLENSEPALDIVIDINLTDVYWHGWDGKS